MKFLKLLHHISNQQNKEKAVKEYKKYKDKTLSTVEKDYLENISALEKKAKKKHCLE